VVRDRINRGTDHEFDWLVDGLTPDAEDEGVSLQKRFFGNFSAVAKVGSALAPVSNWAASLDVSRRLLESAIGVDARRDLPSFERETFVEWFTSRGPGVAESDASREAVVYPDVYTNHVQVERGKATVRALEALGVHVRVPDVPSSGRAPLSQGMIATAEEKAHAVYGALAEEIDAGRDIVVVEPSDLAMFDREYEKFLAPESQRRLSEASYEVMEYVYGLLENGADAGALETPRESEGVAYHSHCQQRTLGLNGYTETVLGDLGYDVVTSDVECCGMAGSFGYKSEYYDLSMDVGDDLRSQFSTPETRERTVVASGTSCLEQLDSMLARPSQHPVELVAPDGR
jgi:Fe-S oxidoreductase